MNARQARKVRAGQPVPLQLHRINTSLLQEGTTCTVAGRCTHDCNEGRSCTCSTPDSRVMRRAMGAYIALLAACAVIAWVFIASPK